MNLKEQLDGLLSQRHISASELSKEVDIPKSTISDWLSGTSPKNIDQVKKVADYFEVSIDYLCFGQTQNQSEISEYTDEINAGVFEVVLRRIKK
jgi:transcriptional regulator with XRE-family HTH domain